MKKRMTVLAFVLFASALPVFSAPNLLVFGTDMHTFAQQLGEEMLPDLRSAAVSGVGLDAASSSPFPRFSIALNAGSVLSSGLFSFVDKSPSPFQLLDFNALANAALSGSSSLQNLYSGMKSFFPYPVGRIGIGLGSVAGFDTQLQFAIWPEALTDALMSAANVTGLQLSTLNVGIRLRRNLITEQSAIPGLSATFGYVFSDFSLKYSLGDAGNVSMAGSSFAFKGTLLAQSLIHSFGADLVVYKTFGVIRLYGGLGLWEQINYYKGGVENFNVDTVPASGNDYNAQGGTDPLVEQTLSVLTSLVLAGVDFKFGGFDIYLHGQFDPIAGVPSAGLGMGFGF